MAPIERIFCEIDDFCKHSALSVRHAMSGPRLSCLMPTLSPQNDAGIAGLLLRQRDIFLPQDRAGDLFACFRSNQITPNPTGC